MQRRGQFSTVDRHGTEMSAEAASIPRLQRIVQRGRQLQKIAGLVALNFRPSAENFWKMHLSDRRGERQPCQAA